MTEHNDKNLYYLIIIFCIFLMFISSLMILSVSSDKNNNEIDNENKTIETENDTREFLKSSSCRNFGLLQHNSTHCLIKR